VVIGTPNTARGLLVGEIFDPNQKHHRPLLLRQWRKDAEQLTVLECPILTAVDPRKLGLGDFQQRIGYAAAPLAVLIVQKSVVEDRV